MIKKFRIILASIIFGLIGTSLVFNPAMADVRSGVTIKLSPVTDFQGMDILLKGDYDHDVVYLSPGDSYKVPSKYTKTLKVTLFGTGWRQRWDLDKKGYGGCHAITGNSYSTTFKPSHSIKNRVDFITYEGGTSQDNCRHI